MLENLIFEFHLSPVWTTVELLLLSFIALGAPIGQTELYISNRKKKKRPCSKSMGQLLYASAVIIALVLEAGLLFYYAGDYGRPAQYYFLDNGKDSRIAVLYQKKGSGQGSRSHCRLRTHSMNDGRLIGQSEIRVYHGCHVLGGTGSVIWLKAHGRHGVEEIGGRSSAIALNLFTGKSLGTIETLLQDKLPEGSEFQLKNIDEHNGYVVRMQNNSALTAKVKIPTDSLSAVRLRTDTVWSVYKRPNLFRAASLKATAENGQKCCDRLVFHYSTAFGAGNRMFSWFNAEGDKQWSKPYEEVLDTDSDPVAVTWNKDEVFIAAWSSGWGDGYLHKIVLSVLKGKEGHILRQLSL